MSRIPFRLQRLLVALAALAVPAVAHLFHKRIVQDGYPLCAYRSLTGSLCVFCGLTRALSSAVRGDLAAANAYNPLWWLAAGLLGVIAVCALHDAVTGRRSLDSILAGWKRLSGAVLVLVVVGTVLRAFL